MSFHWERLRSKEEIFEEGDQDCREHAAYLKQRKEVFIDEEFPPTRETLGVLKDIDTGEKDEEDLDNEWLAPHQFSNSQLYRLNNFGKYQMWTDPWPFHVCQGRLGDCWLIAAIMTIARKKKLLEELIPRNDYTADTGVVQVRLFIDGKWNVIKTDYFLPHIDRFERFAKMPKRQAWVAFIEKAYAKTQGTFGGLTGGFPHNAFRTLTGCMTKMYIFGRNVDKDKMWAEVNEWLAADFLVCVATPTFDDQTKKEVRYFDRHMISDEHSYAILGTTVENGDRLFHLGSNSTLKWNGKWSEKPGYDEGTLSKLSVQDRQLSDKKTFWIGIDDFVMFFDSLFFGEYKEGWKEIRMKQIVKRSEGDPEILRLDIKKRSDVIIEVISAKRHFLPEYPLFLNIHHSNPSNECGELIHTSHRYDSQISSDIVHLDAGTYLVVLTAIGSNGDEQENNWVIRSPMPFEEQGSSSFSFVICPQMILLDSVQKVLMKYGKAEQCDKNNVIIYKWHGKQTGIVMVDNRNEWNWLRVRGTVTSPVWQRIKKSKMFNSWLSLPVPVPPKSRAIVGYYAQIGFANPNCSMEVSYSISHHILNWIHWLDRLSFDSDFEAAVPLNS